MSDLYFPFTHDKDRPLNLEEFAQLEPLWDKAIQSPAEISIDEKHQLMEWPPRAEMEAKALKYLGLSVDDLFQKAATAPLTLTYPECCLIEHHFRIIAVLNREAEDSILTPTELQAIRNVEGVARQIQKTAHAEIREMFKDRERPYGTPPQWIQNIIDQGDDKTWGYVFYHHKEIAGWSAFVDDFNGMLAMRTYLEGEQEVLEAKQGHFIPFDTDENDISYLRQDFLDHREGGALKAGILKNVFFLLTSESRQSFVRHGTEEFSGWFWAIDPNWSSLSPDEEGYDGRLKINGSQVFWRFYEFMSSGKFTLKDVWRDFHAVNAEKRYPCFAEPVAWHFTMLDRLRWPFE
ncbi:hypothetical protein N7452_003372 [Penicillium brevicompactum]|uniref:Uncharacterized protein n=1 Tax=Penicillium brevicompactum TaxID=5074 RepID=A0A9W9UKM9_PENBR|nr:hypothetical protein N7452_003372 [Penicillium brevicompactum]